MCVRHEHHMNIIEDKYSDPGRLSLPLPASERPCPGLPGRVPLGRKRFFNACTLRAICSSSRVSVFDREGTENMIQSQ